MVEIGGSPALGGVTDLTFRAIGKLMRVILGMARMAILQGCLHVADAARVQVALRAG